MSGTTAAIFDHEVTIRTGASPSDGRIKRKEPGALMTPCACYTNPRLLAL